MKKILALLSFVLFISTAFAQTSQATLAKFQKRDTANIQLASASASVTDLHSGITLYDKNAHTVVPIASITKLMTAMVVLDADLPLDEKIRVTREDRARINNGYSRIRLGSELSRGDLLRITLMSSENLAASALGSNYPGGTAAFVKAMNDKAKALGMTRTRFVETSGLSANNVSTASDLIKMVTAAAKYARIREFSTTPQYVAHFQKPRYRLQYTNTNALVRAGRWNISLSKTGYLDEAGRCLVMLTEVDGHEVVMVMLDSFGKRTPLGDANRIKQWLQTGQSGKIAGAARHYERTKTAEYKNR